MTRIYVLGHDARDFAAVRDQLELLKWAGADLRLLTVGRASTAVAGLDRQPSVFEPAAAKRGSPLRVRLVRKAARWAVRFLPRRARLLVALKYGPLAPEKGGVAPQYIALSNTVAWPAGWATVKRRRYVVVGPRQAEAHLTEIVRLELSRRYAKLVNRMRTGKISFERIGTRADWQFLMTDTRVAAIGIDLGDYPSDVIRLATHAALGPAQSVLDLAIAMDADDVRTVEHAAAQEIVAITRYGMQGYTSPAVVQELSDAADAAYESGDVDRAARLFTHLLMLVFLPGLHTSSASTPIVEDPGSWLSPVKSSKIRQHIIGGGGVSLSGATDLRETITVLRGSYPGFSAPVIEALEGSGLRTTTFLPGDEDRRLVGVVPNEQVVRWLLDADPLPEWEWLDAVEGSRVAFIDWADRSAAIAARFRTSGRTVLRVHSADLLSAWIHLTPLENVDEILVVSEPMADLVRRIVDIPDSTSVRSLANLVDVDRFDRPKSSIASRTVAVVGWAQPVKDPLWALEVLAILRRKDPAWRMKFIGTDFDARGSLAVRTYAAQFRDRMIQDDVRHGVEFVGYTRDLPRVYQDVGFVLSSSLRESFGVALMEGIASGAVPVVRNWPAFSSVNAARRIVEPRWVVEHPEEAASAILRLDKEPDRSAEAQRAQGWLRGRVATTDIAQRYIDIVVGTESGLL